MPLYTSVPEEVRTVHRDESAIRLTSLTYTVSPRLYNKSQTAKPYLCVEMNIGTRLAEEIFEYVEISRCYADCAGSSQGHHTFQCLDLIDILEDIVAQRKILLFNTGRITLPAHN